MTEREARRLVRERSGGRCEMCPRRATDWAHRIARSQGGLWLPSNGLDLCHACHMWTHAERVLAAAGGWIIESGEHPADVEVWLRSAWLTGWHLLLDDGCVTPLWSSDAPTPVLPQWAAAA